jgi:hypothetical protein
MNETELMNRILVAISGIPGVLAWRNNTGATKIGNRFVRYGLCPGSSDIIGLYNGRFFALEVKTARGEVSGSQFAFLKAVQTNGGLGRVVRSVEEAKGVFNET